MTSSAPVFQRNSHDAFFEERDWASAVVFWRQLLTVTDTSSLPAFVLGQAAGQGSYGLADLDPIHQAGHRGGEFASTDHRYSKKKTFALRIGYDGTAYQGYQRQKDLPSGTVRTVEGDVKTSLGGLFSYAAGRTDKDVSAVSQVICVTTSDQGTTAEELVERMRGSAPVREGRLQVFDCQRVPKKFNARSSATWRRYLFLFPLNKLASSELVEEGDGSSRGGDTHSDYDVDVGRVNALLSRLEGRALPFNALAYGDNRDKGEGLQDVCTLYRAAAFVVHGAPTSASIAALADAPVNSEPSSTSTFMCVELVGSRFLRRMVRIIVATAVRDAALTSNSKPDRNPCSSDSLLEDICLRGDRSLASSPVRGDGLCLAGVGYDCRDLALYKFMPKRAREEVLRDGSI